MTIQVKRIYEPPTAGDGKRILVDRLWPRGISRNKARIDLWFKEIAPSDALRKWYQHDPEKWPDFKRKYFDELKANDLVQEFRNALGQGRVTFLFSSKEERLNNAYALKEFLTGKP